MLKQPKVKRSKQRMIPFCKMQGSGNDFILMDNRKGALKGLELAALARTVCHRRFSVGADGMIAIVPSRRADFKWRFFNSDGSEAEMCGNGSRCAAKYAHMKKIAPKKMSFETLAGIIHAEVKDGRVRVQLTGARGLRLDIPVRLDGEIRTGHFINTGVPHIVYLADRLDTEEVVRTGRATRNHNLFRPAGTNVNFVNIVSPHLLKIRTYERGVEGETLACGTGAVAAALVAAALHKASSPIEVLTKGGEKLIISFEQKGEAFSSIHLEGEAGLICEGTLYI